VQQASEAGAEGNSARAEWRSRAGLLAQAILVHLPSIPEQVMQHRIAAVVKQLLLLPSAGKVNDRYIPLGLFQTTPGIGHNCSFCSRFHAVAATCNILCLPACMVLPCCDAQARQHFASSACAFFLRESVASQSDTLMCCRPADLTTELMQLLHSSSHSTLKQLLQPLLLPCLNAVVSSGHGQSQAVDTASDPATSFQHASAGQTAEAKEIPIRGSAWVMLGMLRLHLAAPPVGTDPVGKYALKKAHIEHRLTDDILPETEVDCMSSCSGG